MVLAAAASCCTRRSPKSMAALRTARASLLSVTLKETRWPTADRAAVAVMVMAVRKGATGPWSA